MDGRKDAAHLPDSIQPAQPLATPTAPQPTATASADAVERPPFAGRLSYVFSGRMPTRYAPWVLRDLTAPGWRGRQALRSVLMMVPFAIIVAVLPGAPGTRGMLVAFLIVASGAMGLVLAGSFRNRRLVQNGFPAIVKPEEDEDEAPRADPVAGAVPSAGPTATVGDTRQAVAAPGHAAEATEIIPAAAGVATASPRDHDPEDPDGINA
jgi:Family of unknown function (DUF5313)